MNISGVVSFSTELIAKLQDTWTLDAFVIKLTSFQNESGLATTYVVHRNSN